MHQQLPRRNRKPAAKKKPTTKAAAAKKGPSKGLTELIGRALTDKDLRDALFTNRAAAIKGYTLTKVDRAALDRLTPDTLEEHAGKIGSAEAWAVKVVITKKF